MKQLLKEKYSKNLRKFYRFIFGKKIDYYNCNYDEIISLGYNCEISQRLYDIFLKGKFEHYLYTWSYNLGNNSLINSLNNLSTFANSNYFLADYGMFENENYKIAFHSKYDIKKIQTDEKIHKEAIEELKNRTNYLANKTQKLFDNKKNVLFIIKLTLTNLKEDISFVEKLNETIKNKFTNKNARYTLLVVTCNNNFKKEKFILEDKKHIKIETISSFAKENKTDIGGDILGWYRIFRKYIKNN